jgi:hypothetical protein
MHKRNTLRLLAVLGGTAVWMVLLHLLIFPGQMSIGITGIGMTGVALMVINRDWLHPAARLMPRPVLLRSALIAAVLGASFVLLFGALGA